MAPASVAGLRFTFTNSAGGFVLNPGSNFPNSGILPGGDGVLHDHPRSTLRSTGTPIAFPEALTDVATAAGESPICRRPAGLVRLRPGAADRSLPAPRN